MVFNIARLRELLVTSFASLLASGAVSLVDTPHAYAEGLRLGTWNMQGSSAVTENKWRTTVQQLIRAGGGVDLDILAVQEAGSPPSTAQGQSLAPSIFQNTGWPLGIGNGATVEQYDWNIGTTTRPERYYIYWAKTDPSGNRCNNAIVTDQAAQQVVSFLPPGSRRSVIGVRFGSTWYFTVHARSGVGATSTANDVPSIVESINTVVAQLPGPSTGSTWIALGDWNHEPASVPSFPKGVIPGSSKFDYYFPNPNGSNSTPTYPSTNPQRTYDYYLNNKPNILTDFQVQINNILSDHKPSFWHYLQPPSS
jgi:cytolethal distending toxin subunit B